MRTPHRTLADHSSYSRKNLGEAFYGEAYSRHCNSMRIGSARLLAAIEKARK